MAFILLFAWCFLSASIVPFSSEPYFAGLIINDYNFVAAITIASIGNTLGGITTFWIGRKSGEILIQKFSDKKQKRFFKAQKTIEKYGAISMVLSWVPFLGDLIVLAGGIFKLPYTQSILWMSIGKTTRYIIIAYISIGVL